MDKTLEQDMVVQTIVDGGVVDENVESITVINSSPKKSFFNSFSFYILLLAVLLLPLFFFSVLAISFAKTALMSLATLLILILWIISKLKDTTISFPKHPIVLAGVIVPVVFILSSLFSGAVSNSFFGVGFDVGTAVSVMVMFIALFLTSVILKTKDRIFSFYMAFFISFFIVALYQLLRLIFGANFLSFGVFTSDSANLIGKWNELSIFFGLAVILSLVTLQFLSLNRLFKTITVVALAVSLFFLAVVDFLFAWVVVGLFALISLVYLFISARKSPQKKLDLENTDSQGSKISKLYSKRFSISSLIVLVIAIIFVFWGNPIHATFNKYPNTLGKLNIGQSEVSPSWQYTFDLSKSALKESPIFGIGPNRFVREWLMHKPPAVNSGIFWNVDFLYDIGLIPTYIITTGILGILAWLFFLGAFLWAGFKSIFSPIKDLFTRYLLVSSFFSALYLWVFQVIYVPGQVLFSLAFLFTGVFLAALYQERKITMKSFSYTDNPKVSFVTVLCLVVALIASVSLAYLFIENIISVMYLNDTLQSINVKGDINAGLASLEKAIRFNASDEYYRTKTQIKILQMSAVLNQQNVAAADMGKQLSPILADAITSAQAAIAIDPTNYQNWMNLGQIYEGVLPLGSTGAYQNAKDAYTKALNLNPSNPQIVLALARVEALNKNYPAAIALINQSLVLKPNYTEAIYFAAQMEINRGNIVNAIAAVTQIATYIAPNDPTVFFELGFLKYSNKDYHGAIDALNQAVSLNVQYSNARYFLGLSYARIKDIANAIAEFVEIQKFNPDNKEVQSILANLRSGKDIFATGTTATPTAKGKIKTLPVKDNVQSVQNPPASAGATNSAPNTFDNIGPAN
jgi:cytochrome c-type biogenesis protein CcmH/NrfG